MAAKTDVKKKPGNPKAYAEAQRKAAPRRGLVVNMSIEAFHHYLSIHQLDVVGWNGGVLMVKKIADPKKAEGQP